MACIGLGLRDFQEEEPGCGKRARRLWWNQNLPFWLYWWVSSPTLEVGFLSMNS